jgi:ribonuclease P protein component
MTNNLREARLGIVVAKKNQKKAVHRNRIKRIVRECFRLRQSQISGFDLVVVAKKWRAKASSEDLRRELCEQMDNMAIC